MTEKGSGALLRMSPASIGRVSFGVRYEPQFKVQDRGGEIMDAIMRSPGSPFGPGAFPQVQTTPIGRTLVNPENERMLRVDQQDTILIWNTDTRDLEEVRRLAKDFQEHVLVHLRKIAGVRMILRYGALFRLKYGPGVLKQPPIARYLANEFAASGITTLQMRFTRRLPALEAMAKKGVEDYRQVIYSLDESEDGQVQASMDYQDYFKPMLDVSDWEKKPFARFAEQGMAYFENDFTSWFRAFAGMTEVA